MPPTFVPGPNPYGVPPVYLGALGPIMTRTAAEVADGLLVMPFHSHRHFRERTLPMVDAGLEAAGRTRADLAIQPQAILAMGRTDDELARATVGARTARLLRLHAGVPPVLEVEGLGRRAARTQPALQAGRLGGDVRPRHRRDAPRPLAVRGTPRSAAQVRRRFGDVADRVCAYFPGYDAPLDQVRDLVDALA